MTNTNVMKRASGLVMPTHYVELDADEMSYVDGGDFFVGINLSASFCGALASYVPMSMKTGGVGLGSFFSVAMSIPQVNAVVAPILAGVKAGLAAIPIIGWIAIGVLAAATITVLATALYAGTQGKGFKFGFNVRTGWFGIPKGANFVCEIK
ncbi:MAG: hypothetical protein NC184_02040 [Roseburia sp.]|nr:hypothetical protein [Roseburia sp.]